MIIGAMKAATTSLYRWLQATGLATLPSLKEPNFFTQEWHRGPAWYFSLFEDISRATPTGEASVGYSDPALSPTAAARIAEMLPETRFVFSARHPIDRLRSHFRHEVQRNREKRPFAIAVEDLDSTYVRRSMYGRGLQPYFQLFDAQQILIVEFEDLVGGDGFRQVLHHLGLPLADKPSDAHNVSTEKRRYTAFARFLYERGWTTTLARMPRPVRRLGRYLGTRQDAQYQTTLRESQAVPAPDHVVEALQADVGLLESTTGIRFNWRLNASS
jgi:hypothetical protein